MPDKIFKLYYPSNTVVDPMGSVIINVNTTVQPQFEWAYVNTIRAVGPVDPNSEVNLNLVGFKDTTSYKIKYLEDIPRHNNPNRTIGSAACLNSPDALSCFGYGPYVVLGRRYYIDFIVLYFVNKTTVPSWGSEEDYYLSSPIFSVDSLRCTPDYGIFIAAPKIKTSTLSDNLSPYLEATQGSGDSKMFTNLPSYSNEIGFFNLNIRYRLTALSSDSCDSYMDNVVLTPGNIVNALQNILNYGQTSIVSVMENNTPIILKPQPSSSPPNGGFEPKSYYPFILFRYISENAPTRRVSLSFSFAPNVWNIL